MREHTHQFRPSTKALMSKLLPSVRFDCKCGESTSERHPGDKYAAYLKAKYIRKANETIQPNAQNTDEPRGTDSENRDAAITKAVGEVGQDEGPRGGVAAVEQTGTDS